MHNRKQECGRVPPICLTRVMMVLGYINLLLLLYGSVGWASLSKEIGDGICNHHYRDQGTRLQVDDLSTESPDQIKTPLSPVYRTDGEPVLLKRMLQGFPKRVRKSDGSSYHSGSDAGTAYDSTDGDILKSIILHLIKYPRRFNRAESKSENYNLRANYIPRLGRKRSYSLKK